jgi:hypothetical protein
MTIARVILQHDLLGRAAVAAEVDDVRSVSEEDVLQVGNPERVLLNQLEGVAGRTDLDLRVYLAHLLPESQGAGVHGVRGQKEDFNLVAHTTLLEGQGGSGPPPPRPEIRRSLRRHFITVRDENSQT